MKKFIPFVLHRHEAKKAGLHYDLRLKYPTKKVLASWAIPKATVPMNIGDKLLAVRTPDHPMEWLKFGGEIPDGSYGAGIVTIVQRGYVELLSWSTYAITFIAYGNPLNGKYSLIKFKSKERNTETWLFIKGQESEN